MSRRERGSRYVPARPPSQPRNAPPPPPAAQAAGRDRTPQRASMTFGERIESTTLAERALLPIRFFFGATFLYAGIDKLLDPAFLDTANPASIAGQLQAFTHVSPLAPLIGLVEPFAVPMGLLIAIAEIAIGIGALTGLAFRLAALGGAALSILFWLTASWSTHPYYYGADLPYAIGWIALAIGGTVDVLVPHRIRELGGEPESAGGRSRGGAPLVEPMPGRRTVLQAGLLGAVAVAVAAVAMPVGIATGGSRGSGDAAGGDGTGGTGGTGGTDGAGSTAGTGGTTGQAQRTEAPGPEESPENPEDDATNAPFTPSGLSVASVAVVDKKGAVRIKVPLDAPAPLPAGDPGVIVKLKDGSYAAYDTVCTHEGCRVAWDSQDEILLCPCHGAAFDPNDHGAVLGGPTNTPLAELPIVIDAATGAITLKA